jgi:hypothetical protein
MRRSGASIGPSHIAPHARNRLMLLSSENLTWLSAAKIGGARPNEVEAGDMRVASEPIFRRR